MYNYDGRGMDFNSSCGSQISTASMSTCQYTPQLSEGKKKQFSKDFINLISPIDFIYDGC